MTLAVLFWAETAAAAGPIIHGAFPISFTPTMLLVIVFAAYDGSQVLLVTGLRAEMLLDCSMDTTCLIYTIMRPMVNTGKDNSTYLL